MSANEADKIIEALKGIAPLKGSPRVAGHLIDLGVDEAGDPAVFITVLLGDETLDSEWISAKLEPIADAVRGAVRSTGIARWPYVRFARVSEAGGPNADRPEWKAAG